MAELLFLVLFLVFSISQIFVDHGSYTRVRPHVFGSFQHVDDGVDRKDDSHNTHWSVDARHERKGEKETPHRNAGIAHSRKNGDDQLQQQGRPCKFITAVLHHVEGGGEDKGGTPVHVDGGADGQHEARYVGLYA